MMRVLEKLQIEAGETVGQGRKDIAVSIVVWNSTS